MMKKHVFRLPGLKTAREFANLLEAAGFNHNSIHIAHKDQARAKKYHLNCLNFFEQTDTIHSVERGFIVGMILSATLGFLSFSLLKTHPAGGLTALFICLIALGFPTWLGGLIGASSDNYRLQPHHNHLQHGGAAVLIDVIRPAQKDTLNTVVANFAPAELAGITNHFDNPIAGHFLPRKLHS